MRELTKTEINAIRRILAHFLDGGWAEILEDLQCAAQLAAIPASERLASGACPVATVVISGGGLR